MKVARFIVEIPDETLDEAFGECGEMEQCDEIREAIELGCGIEEGVVKVKPTSGL